MTWDQFVDVFLETFLPYGQRDRMHDEFDLLAKGSMIAAEYEA